jgi:hypothetical protein
MARHNGRDLGEKNTAWIKSGFLFNARNSVRALQTAL